MCILPPPRRYNIGLIARIIACYSGLVAMFALTALPHLSAISTITVPTALAEAVSAESIHKEAENLSRILDEHRDLLEKGLNIYEIDQEIKRIIMQEQQVAEQIRKTERRLVEEEKIVKQKRERVGHILRAYYSGERINLFMVLFQIRDWSDAWTIIEYLQVIFLNDRELINSYLDSYRQLKASHEQLLEIQRQLAQIHENYLSRREQLVKMQTELDEELQQLDEAEMVMAQIEELTREWEQHGLPLFRRYFAALAEAMEQLPEMINDYEDVLTSRGLTWTFHVSDDVLNDFLRRRNEQFNNLTFTFQEGRLIAEGEEGDVVLYIAGHYKIEDEPVNHIGFELEELRYRGFELPDATRDLLTEEFDLGFYPHYIVPFVVASDILIEDGSLKVTLNLTMSSRR
jgi:peptidoglycan hydrolase CwlO-like protein